MIAPFCVIQKLTFTLEKRLLMASGVGGGPLKRIPATTRILLGSTLALIPQKLKHINFSLQNSEKAVNVAQTTAKT